MKRLAIGVAIGVALLVAACAGGNRDEAASTGDQDLSLLELKCSAGSMHFYVEPAFGGVMLGGTLKTDSLTSEFVCKTPPAGDAGTSVVVSCTERPQSAHPGRWTVEVTNDADGQHARVTGEGAPTDALTCAGQDDNTPVLPYATIAGYVQNICGGCHGDKFDSLEKIKAQHEIMLGLISTGAMPRGKPTWKTTPEGKAVIAFLSKSPEVQ